VMLGQSGSMLGRATRWRCAVHSSSVATRLVVALLFPALLLVGCGSSGPARPKVCRLKAQRAIARDLHIGTSTIHYAKSVGGNDMPQCSFTARAAGHRVLVVVNVDDGRRLTSGCCGPRTKRTRSSACRLPASAGHRGCRGSALRLLVPEQPSTDVDQLRGSADRDGDVARRPTQPGGQVGSRSSGALHVQGARACQQKRLPVSAVPPLGGRARARV